MPNDNAIVVESLGRVYKIRGGKKKERKDLVALSGVNLTIKKGELFGLLGPNGAGKTTLIKILTTLLSPTSGKASVAGLDVYTQPEQIRARINMVSGGETSGYGLLTVRENLWMFAQFYGIPSKAAYERIDSLLAIVGMADRRNTKCSDLSTGLRQKMNIVRGFLTDPQILFLDEPTLGLDVAASRDVRSFIQRWMQENRQRSLLLTTHYMAEADELCDRVAIVNRGKVLACDSPAHLNHMLQGEALFQVWVSADGSLDSAGLLAINGVNQAAAQETPEGLRIDLRLQEESVLPAVFNELNRQQRAIFSLQKREPTLEDVFMRLVGQRMEDIEDDSAAAA